MAEYLSLCEEDTQKIARDFALALPDQAIVTFDGDLGSGKTTFIKALVASASGIDENCISSPTFSLLHTYTGKKTVHHFDLYRLASEEEFFDLGVFDLFAEPSWVLIEWPDKIKRYLLAPYFQVQIAYRSEKMRSITILTP
ncbi:MAG: yjeE [Chlamydiales bacterium]|jgi:tRNA threonylcarbamoyladenosine biosynthesis protein TsaE|nr:yjeE [Chlamydiales bacterium]